ncbi:coproporphyrinogen III oxidase [Streptomyces abyssalis]|uniref:Heme chaperone HemW n=1 Tax=Streptomyces abyssalis TaxID=933944 RepID=A0A1E7JSX7_9ACTN|nr:radical SAM protein [Streptomyces abyssalis]OEU91976.1 coproporphyrinogen III oxidase [Streptomyces abyssalis]OEU93881.1 coproporphyrinogen III oxidase [Streptomyces abyssalis]
MTTNVELTGGEHRQTYEESLASLRQTDPRHPEPAVLERLAAPENRHLLEYVTEDPFGAHVFPGNIPGFSPADFLSDLDDQLAQTAPIHLWSYIPTCAYRCRFCQYPVVLVKGAPEVAESKANQWVDWNIREAELWLREVPHLASAPIGEFNVFGGTPSLLPPDAIRRLLGFYKENFNFAPDTAIRFEGDPSTFTPEKLELLAELGCTKLSSGVQSFDDPVLEQCGREHTAQMCVDFVRNAQRTGFEWISIDLMYGLLDQTVDSVRRDLDIVVENELTAVVCTKLHLASYSDTRTGVAGVQPAAWQLPDYRDKLVRDGHRWPTLGEQYQMRELLTEGLESAGYREQPTMYFARDGLGPEKWKSIMVDQDKQEAEVAIGLGGSSSCRTSEAITDVNWKTYSEAVEAGRVPLGSATRFSEEGQEARAVKMALSTLRPLSGSLHRQRFPGTSLFEEPWLGRFRSLEERGLAVVDRDADEIRLTPEGKVLVEAVINSEL